MRIRIAVLVLGVLSLAIPSWAADDGPKTGTLTTVTMKSSDCTTGLITVKELGVSYFEKSQDAFLGDLKKLLTSCDLPSAWKEYVVILFAAKPTDGAEKPSIIHVILHVKSGKPEQINGLPGVTDVTWVYITDDQTDRVRIQLNSSAVENPLVAQIGPLAAAIAPVAFGPAAVLPPPRKGDKSVHLWTGDARLPFKRATISESDFIQRIVPDDDKDKTRGATKPIQLEGEATFGNVPASWVTIHAGVGVLTGKIHGVAPAKVDDKAYAADPISRAVTVAGVALHVPFDSTTPRPTLAEQVGVVIAATLTPAGGIYVGPSYGWRGFSFTGGPTWMWVHTTPYGFSIDDEVVKKADGGPEEQLVYGRVRAWFLGGTFTFK